MYPEPNSQLSMKINNLIDVDVDMVHVESWELVMCLFVLTLISCIAFIFKIIK